MRESVLVMYLMTEIEPALSSKMAQSCMNCTIFGIALNTSCLVENQSSHATTQQKTPKSIESFRNGKDTFVSLPGTESRFE